MILAAGLSPAWQQVMWFDRFLPGEVNRARAVRWCASGKVLNAARAMHHLGGPCKALTVVGGHHGVELCRDFAAVGIPGRWVETTASTRVCTTLIDSTQGTATELVENASPIREDELAAFAAAFAEEARAAAVVVLIGSLPAGTPTSFYRDLLAKATGRVLVDARGEELRLALAARPFLVKPNRGELSQTVGRPLPTEADVIEAMQEVNRLGATWVVVTDGAKPVHVATAGRVWRADPLACPVVNPIGCGDCLAGGIAWSLAHGGEPLEAIRLGLGAAADKVSRPLPGEVKRTRVDALASQVKFVPL